MHSLDMATAVRYLSESDTALQILGAAYIQHQCYHSNDAKKQVTAAGMFVILLFYVMFPSFTVFIFLSAYLIVHTFLLLSLPFMNYQHLLSIFVLSQYMMCPLPLSLRSVLYKVFQLWSSFSPVTTKQCSVMPQAPRGTSSMKTLTIRWHS